MKHSSGVCNIKEKGKSKEQRAECLLTAVCKYAGRGKEK